jgi:hypothetical protein
MVLRTNAAILPSGRHYDLDASRSQEAVVERRRLSFTSASVMNSATSAGQAWRTLCTGSPSRSLSLPVVYLKFHGTPVVSTHGGI